MSWIKFNELEAPDGAVLAACDTYDCGWVIDSAWWNKDEKCWMTTGAVSSDYAHLPYSHWMEMPQPPKN